jgi:hypothetical protein
LKAALPLSQLRALLRWCPNVVSLRQSSIDLPNVGEFIATELGMAGRLSALGPAQQRQHNQKLFF